MAYTGVGTTSAVPLILQTSLTVLESSCDMAYTVSYTGGGHNFRCSVDTSDLSNTLDSSCNLEFTGVGITSVVPFILQTSLTPLDSSCDMAYTLYRVGHGHNFRYSFNTSDSSKCS